MPGLRICMLLFSSLYVGVYATGDVLGCGGYVRSDVDINFAQVGMKLYTKQGSLKYETECAPNNGYYFMPIYDKGEYVVKVSPPPGWSFEPEEVALKVDGETDACSLGRDINFHFKGFAVIGKVVSAGSESGPQGVAVNLYRGEVLVQSTHTSLAGDYVFTPLSSGTYIVRASHPSWTFLTDMVTVEVADENGDAGSSIMVGGYTMAGAVTMEGEAVQGVVFCLHAAQPLITTPDCTPGEPEGYKNSLDVPVVCHTASGADGTFLFSSVPPGTYTLTPHFHSSTTKYKVTPGKLEVTQGHDDLTLEQVFKVEGFSMSGVVRNSKGGAGVAGASLVLDKTLSTTTNHQGHFLFHNTQSGKHRIKVTAEKYEFEEVVVSISAQAPVVPDITPVGYQACFTVSVETAAPHPGPWTIDISGSEGKQVSVETSVEGSGCVFLSPGQYSAAVRLTQAADQAGMRFGPQEHIFIVESDPIEELSFSQFLGEISGKISCLEKCPDLTVTLRPARSGSGAPRSVTVQAGRFTIKEVVPGSYQLTVQKDEWCWQQKTVPLTVNTENVEAEFVQVGYQLTLASSHQTTLSYTTNTGASGTVVAQKGSTLVCMSAPGLYTLTPVGCHKFGAAQIQWDTSALSLVTLSATKHQLTGAVRATEAAPFTVEVKVGDQLTVLGPLNPSPEDGHLYVFELWVREGEVVTLTPGSPTNLYQYQPASHTLSMPGDCVLGAVTFTAERALFIHGRVTPPIGGVTISVEGNGKIYTYYTDEEGRYSAGPLDNSVQFSVTAEMKGYVMNTLSEKGHFEAYKLAEVVVEVKDEFEEPLAGVLVSMSGGKSYRQNSLTDAEGKIGFGSLSPSDYFLRPMMKEYKFEPSSKMVSVDEGAAVLISIRGQRVAYSVYGHTVSLSGEAETEVVVEAVGVGEECNQYQEEAVSDAQGSFRIRGLLPKCQYELKLKTGPGINPSVERTVPRVRLVGPGEEDVRDVRLVVVRPFTQMDVAAKVDVESQYLSSLTAHLYRTDLPDAPVHSVKLGLHPYFLLPPLTADRRTYFLRLESNLPASQYDYVSPEVSFVADAGFKHLSLSFSPSLRSVDAEMSQGTVVGFAFAILMITLAFNYHRLGGVLEKAADLATGFSSKKNFKISSSDAPVGEAVRKKVKPRKI